MKEMNDNEIIEEFAKRISNNDENSKIKSHLNYQDGIFYGIQVGAKWQQEQVIKLLKDNDYENEAVFEFLTEEFFNQNKK